MRVSLQNILTLHLGLPRYEMLAINSSTRSKAFLVPWKVMIVNPGVLLVVDLFCLGRSGLLRRRGAGKRPILFYKAALLHKALF